MLDAVADRHCPDDEEHVHRATPAIPVRPREITLAPGEGMEIKYNMRKARASPTRGLRTRRSSTNFTAGPT
jgi:hypothetical protein